MGNFLTKLTTSIEWIKGKKSCKVGGPWRQGYRCCHGRHGAVKNGPMVGLSCCNQCTIDADRKQVTYAAMWWPWRSMQPFYSWYIRLDSSIHFLHIDSYTSLRTHTIPVQCPAGNVRYYLLTKKLFYYVKNMIYLYTSKIHKATKCA